MAKLQLHNPLKRVVITQGYGLEGTHPSMVEKYKTLGLKDGLHNGLDMAAADGTPVYASHDGRVTFAGYDGSGGLGVVIRTNEPVTFRDGSESYAKTIYWHLKKDSLLVTGGQEVKAGQQIGGADNTGFSTGSHLHYSLKPIARGENDWTWYNVEQSNGLGGNIDPAPYLIPFQMDMEYGQTWEEIKTLQKALIQLGFFVGEPYAKYGKMTQDAVLKFQKKYCKLSYYEEYVMRGSKVGSKTRAALNKLWEDGVIKL